MPRPSDEDKPGSAGVPPAGDEAPQQAGEDARAPGRPSRAARRRRAVQLGFGLIGLAGLTTMVLMIKDQPWAKAALGGLIAWQSFWYGLRVLVMIGIWRREPELSNSEKWWIAITVPIGILFAIWLGRGKLSEWIAADEARENEVCDDGS